MALTVHVCDSLVAWFQSLTQTQGKGIEEINDGYVILEALTQISPSHFNQLESKIKTSVGLNWRLKVSNLKKIKDSLLEYFQDVLALEVPEKAIPDVVKLGETNDLLEFGKLLLLIFKCAVSCDKKKIYITELTKLDQIVQNDLMLAYQQLDSSMSQNTEPNNDASKLTKILNTTIAEKTTLAQKCHKFEEKLALLQEERNALAEENKKLKEEGPGDIKTKQIDTKKQLELLKEEIFRLEALNFDYNDKISVQEKEIVSLKEKIFEMQINVKEVDKLKDEIDVLSQTAEKAQKLETQIVSYKKRLEDYSKMKTELKILQQENQEYLELNFKYEADIKELDVWKVRSETYKKQMADLQQELEEQTNRVNKSEIIEKNLEMKYETVLSERDNLVNECIKLREENDDLRLGNYTDRGMTVSEELTPTEMKERLKILTGENNSLRKKIQNTEQNRTMLDDALTRVNVLNDKNKSATQRILELETNVDSLTGQLQEKNEILNKYKEEMMKLQEALTAKSIQFRDFQMAYTENMEKAKQTIKMSQMKKTEEKLLTTAFYRLGARCQRDTMDNRLNLLGSAFLDTQRIPQPRKPSIVSRHNLK